MKKTDFLIITPLLLILTLLASCNDNNLSEDERESICAQASALRLKEKEKKQESYGGEITNKMYYINCTWTTQGLPSWIKQTPLSGGSSGASPSETSLSSDDITYTLAQNYATTQRSAIVNYQGTTVGGGEVIDQTCSFVQTGAYNCYVKLTNTESDDDETTSLTNLPVTSSQVVLYAKTNVDLTVSNAVAWITVSQQSIASNVTEEGTFNACKITFTIDANPSTSERKGVINFYQGSKLAYSLSFSQKGASTETDETDISMPRNASTKVCKLNSDLSWKAVVSSTYPSVKNGTINIEEASWLNVSPQTGEAGTAQSLTLSTTDNTDFFTRSAYVVICDPTLSHFYKVISVTQDPSFLQIAKDESYTKSCTMQGGSLTTKVSSNTNWKVYSHPDWMKPKTTSGKGDATIEWEVERNLSGSQRSGYVEILAEGASSSNWSTSANYKATFYIEQAAADIQSETSEVMLSANACQQKLKITADAEWTAQIADAESASWLQISPTSGTGNGTLTLSATDNNTKAIRSASVNLKMGNITRQIAVTQQSKYIYLSQSAIEVSSKPNDFELSVSSSSNWTVSIPQNMASWASASATSGKGDETIVFHFADNPSSKERNGEITVKLNDGQTVVANIRQKPRYLTLSTPLIQLFAKGGSNTLNVSTDGTLAYEKQGDWFSLLCTNAETGTYTLSAAPNATNAKREGTVTFRLTDLRQGDALTAVLKVVQVAEGSSFSLIGYENDNSFNQSSNSQTTTINIGRYANDESFNNSSNSQSATLQKGNYTNDKNFN